VTNIERFTSMYKNFTQWIWIFWCTER